MEWQMIYIFVTIIVIGIVLYLVENYIPMDPPIKVILRAVVVLLLLLWILQSFGIIDMPLRQVR